jgi:hypothetical protein
MHEEIAESLEAYALGALDPATLSRVEAHLATCASCRRLVAEYQDVADSLPGALALAVPSAPSEATWHRLSRRITTRRRWRSLAVAAAVAGVVLFALSLGWSVQLSTTLAQERAQFEQLASEQELIFEVVDAPDSRRVILRPPTAGSPSYGKVFTRPDMPFVVAMAGRLPEPPPDRVYHLWLTLSTGELHHAGTIEPNAEGFGSLVYEAPANGPELQSARLTLDEPDPPAPEGVPVLLWVR